MPQLPLTWTSDLLRPFRTGTPKASPSVPIRDWTTPSIRNRGPVTPYRYTSATLRALNTGRQGPFGPSSMPLLHSTRTPLFSLSLSHLALLSLTLSSLLISALLLISAFLTVSAFLLVSDFQLLLPFCLFLPFCLSLLFCSFLPFCLSLFFCSFRPLLLVSAFLPISAL